MHEKVLAILASARGNSNTLKAVQALSPFPDYNVVDLSSLRIHPYRYDKSHLGNDDFLTIAQQMKDASILLFATPVYWYSMSGAMKVFFDRFTDLLSDYKQIGKALKGKKVFLIAQGASPDLPPGFEVPFQLTSEYFEMEFQKTFYLQMN